MLGYVRAFKPELKMKDYELYRGVYCSLCRALGRNYSPIAQLFLSYDFAFAAIVRLACAQGGCTFSQKRCPYNPAKKCMICSSRDELDYCSHAAVITIFYKLADDLHDAGIKSRIRAVLLYPIVWLMHKKAARLAPEAEKIIASSMKNQSLIEKKEGVCLDEAAHGSAHALGKVISAGFDAQSGKALYNLGYMIGRFVYIIDAADDLESDIKSGAFNPFKAEFPNISGKEREHFANRAREALNLTHSAALEALDTADKKRFGDILENIVFDGLENSAEKVLKKFSPKCEEKSIFTVE